jgi:hypothetical protein
LRLFPNLLVVHKNNVIIVSSDVGGEQWSKTRALITNKVFSFSLFIDQKR